MVSPETRIGIIAGGGSLPAAVAQSAMNSGNDIYIIGIKGEADPSIERYPHCWARWGEIGRLLATLEDQKCSNLVIIGSVSRPDLSEIRFDFGAVKHLPTILGLTIGGDDTVLKNVIRFFEGKGLTISGAHEVAPDLVAERGRLGRHAPDDADLKDIRLASGLLDALGPYDAGQAAVVTREHVIAIEAAEGTDEMLARAAALRQWGRAKKNTRAGILMKKPKPGQELRVDMPVIGPKTIAGAVEAGLSGIALSAGHVLLAEREKTIRDADEAGLFLVGIDTSDQ